MNKRELAVKRLKMKGVETMRDLKEERFNLRLTETSRQKLERLSEFLEISLTQVILTAVDLLAQELQEFTEGEIVG